MGIIIKTRISLQGLPYFIIALCAFSIPIGSGINLITGFPFSKIFLGAVMLIIVYAILFMRFRRYMVPFFIQLYIAFIVVHTIITYLILKPEYLLIDYYEELFIISLVRFIIFILFYLFILQFLNNEKLLKTATFYYSIGYIFTVILGVFVPQSELDMGRISGGFENPNSFGASSIILIFLNLYQWILQADKKNKRSTYLIFILFGLAGLILSQSRGAMAGLMVGIFAFLMWMPGLERKIKIFTGVLMSAGLIIVFIPSEIIQQFSERANIGERISSGSESRIIIWSSYLKEVHEYWAFGAGRNQSHEIITSYDLPAKWRAPHNRYLFILVEFGFLALVSYLLGVFQLFRRTYRNIKGVQARLVRSLILVWIIMMLFGDYKNSRDFWFFMALVTSLTFMADKTIIPDKK